MYSFFSYSRQRNLCDMYLPGKGFIPMPYAISSLKWWCPLLTEAFYFHVVPFVNYQHECLCSQSPVGMLAFSSSCDAPSTIRRKWRSLDIHQLMEWNEHEVSFQLFLKNEVKEFSGQQMELDHHHECGSTDPKRYTLHVLSHMLMITANH